MLYEPNYCCNCGEKIERVYRRLWHSRRFCELCETEHKLEDFTRIAFPVFFLLVGAFGFWAYLNSDSGAVKESDLKLSLKSSKTSETIGKNVSESPKSSAKNALQIEPVEKKAPAAKREVRQTLASTVEKEPTRKVVVAKNPQKEASEPVYFCGAKTKKGSPCSRKVKGGGRCWQHEGRKAIVGKNDLLVDTN